MIYKLTARGVVRLLQGLYLHRDIYLQQSMPSSYFLHYHAYIPPTHTHTRYHSHIRHVYTRTLLGREHYHLSAQTSVASAAVSVGQLQRTQNYQAPSRHPAHRA